MIVTSSELEEMSTEAARDDGRLARRPLENKEREIHAHRMLLMHLDKEIQGYFTAIEVRIPILIEVFGRGLH
jgi:histone-lysine N-methyltransferase SETD3